MSYAFAWPLQQALYAALTADPEVQALAGGRVHDQAPHAEEAGLSAHVTIGEETVEPWSTASDDGAAHVVTLAVAGPEQGFGPLKRLAGAVSAAALGPLGLSRGRVVDARFLGAKAQRAGGWRRIDLRFRYLIEE